jgi:hypothetical protein
MRFMVIVKANEDSEAGKMPSLELLQAMGAFNEDLAAKGYLVSADGLHPSSNGSRLTWTAGKLAVTDGPFAETKELIAGYWVVDMPSKDAVLETFSRCPAPHEGGNGVIEIRKVFEPEDFAGVAPPEMIEREREMRSQLER